MRVTNRSLISGYTVNLERNLYAMKKYQSQLSTGKELSKPSDNPLDVTRAMVLRSTVSANEQYSKNIDYATGWIDKTDSVLRGIIDSLQSIRELIVRGANGTNDSLAMEAIAKEVYQMTDQIADLGNANYDGRYILSGHHTLDKPLAMIDGVLTNVAGDDEKIFREISPGVTTAINTNITEIMNDGKTDLGQLLNGIYQDLLSGDTHKLGNKHLEDLDNQINNLLGITSTVGAKHNRMEAAQEKNSEEMVNLREVLSKVEDIDFAEKIMEYAMMESIYHASLSTGAKVLQRTLLDYL